MRILLFICAFLLFGHSQAQEVLAILEFDTDTVSLGRPVPLHLSISHPEDIVVVFPVGKKEFEPFELAGRKVEPTLTDEGLSVDAVTYQLRTFDLAPKQAVSLSYAYVVGKDTIREIVRSDSLRLNFQVHTDPDAGAFQTIDGVLPLSPPPNYGLWTMLGVMLLILLGALAVLLRRPIDRYLRLQRLKQEWMEVRKQLKRLGQHSNQTYQLDQMNHLWKGYIDPDDAMGFLSMTTTELKNNLPLLMFLTRSQKDILLQAAMAGDKVIYANEQIPKDEVDSLIWNLHEIIDTVYGERQELIKRKN
ncbi:MAG: hypothetical protein AAF587_39400 [Bacteroidota bacterium]